MKEISKIVHLYKSLEGNGRKAALATVVGVEGSSYRRQGAKMLISDDGRWEGSISGGCLEGDALRKARAVIATGTPMLVTYDTMEDGAGSLGIGLGCNGIIHVFIEPIHENSSSNPLNILQTILQTKEEIVSATVLEDLGAGMMPGTRFLFSDSVNSHIPDWLFLEMEKAQQSGKPAFKTLNAPNGCSTLFIEKIDPGISLVICGAGYDAAPLAALAHELGWQVSVTEDCIAHLLPKKFPSSCELILANSREVTEKIGMNKKTAVVLLSHNYKYDLAVLESLLPLKLPYIGILGPASRFIKMKSELQNKNSSLDLDQLEQVFAPAGLDIGAETPEEIAFSIIGEIKAVFSGRAGGFLKYRQGPIHERSSDKFVPATNIQHVA